MQNTQKTVTIEYGGYEWTLSQNSEYTNFYRAELRATAMQYLRQFVGRAEKEFKPRQIQLMPYFYDILGYVDSIQPLGELELTESEIDSQL